MDKTALEALVRQVLLERLGGGTHGVKAVQVPRIAVTEEHRMDTGNPLDRVRRAGGADLYPKEQLHPVLRHRARPLPLFRLPRRLAEPGRLIPGGRPSAARFFYTI